MPPIIHDTWADSLTPHGLELFYSGAWHDITPDLGDDGVRITRGRRQDRDRVPPADMALTLDNTGGKYSPRNPRSSLYGLIGRGTPIRYWVEAGSPRLVIPEAAGAVASTPDSAGLSVTTGDLDVRIDMRRGSWREACTLIGKYRDASNQRSWALCTNGLFLQLLTSTNGIAVVTATSTAVLPHNAGRFSVRVVFDADDGTGHRGYDFYYSETPGLNGPWTQLGGHVTGGVTASLFDSAAPLEVGDSNSLGRIEAEVYSARVSSGSVVASPDFEGQPSGTTSFADAQGNTWTMSGGATLTNQHYRFTGEVVAWPQQWSMKGVAWTPIQCAGVTRRMGQGKAPLKSAYYRGCTSTVAPVDALVGYWPLEDPVGTVAPASGLPGGRFGAVGGSPRFASDSSSFACSASLPIFGAGDSFIGWLNPYTPSGQVQAFLLVNVPDDPPATDQRVFMFTTSGTAYLIDFTVNTSMSWECNVYDPGRNLIGTVGPFTAIPSGPKRLALQLEQNGSDIDVTISYLVPGASSGFFGAGTISGASLGAVRNFAIGADGDLDGWTVGHLTFQDTVNSVWDFFDLLNAHSPETAWQRLDRLAEEEAVTVALVGGNDTESMGYQLQKELLDLLQEAQDTDGGMLYEPRGSADLAYRTRSSIESQRAAVTIQYTGNLLLPFEPTEDDQDTVNRSTVTREGGASYTAEEPAGPLGIVAVGLYDSSATLSLAEDEDTADQASWRVHAGTIDEARWPRIGIDLAHPVIKADTDLIRDVLTMDLGDRLVVWNLPEWLPPFDVDQIVQGYTEVITPKRYKLTLNCTPASVYRVGVYNTDEARYSGEGTVTAEALDATETGVDITCPAALRWGHDDGDYLIVIGGEVMQVTAVSGTGTAQTMTVVRSINGVAKTHSIGAAVDLYLPVYYGL